MPSVRKVEHGPKVGVRVGFRDLVERRVIRVDDLVDRAPHARVLDRPLELTRGLAPNGFGFARGRVTAFGASSGRAVGWEELGYAEVALRGRGEEVVGLVLRRRKERERVSWPARYD